MLTETMEIFKTEIHRNKDVQNLRKRKRLCTCLKPNSCIWYLNKVYLQFA